jgi:hypothetical protein
MKVNKIPELLKPLIIIFILFLIGLFITSKNYYYLNKCSIYTVGRYTKNYSSRQGKSVWFTYMLNNKSYESPLTLKEEQRIKEKLIYIRIACDNPNIIEGIWDKKVDSTHLRNLPPNGWDKLPD